jgi:bifunctional DNA-binding transcriptional regulator/antitoxin component of YhaV-PrlF toxin-antitoxin module
MDFTLNSKNRITLTKEIVEHLGAKPGGKLELVLEPNRGGILVRRKESIPVVKDDSSIIDK